MRRWLVPSVACALGALSVGLILPGVLPVGVEREWVWPRSIARQWGEVLPAVVFFALFLSVVVASLKRFASASRWQRGATVGLLVALAFALQLAVARMSPVGLYELPFAVSVPKANSYFRRAADITNVREYVREYDRELRAEPFRVQLSTHPPGPVMLFWGVQQLYQSSRALTAGTLWLGEELAPPRPELAALLRTRLLPQTPELRAAAWGSALMLIAAAALALVPLYAVAARVLSPEAGLLTVAFAALVPSVCLFCPTLDQWLFFVGSVLTWALVRAWDRDSVWIGLLAGVVLAVAVEFSPSVLVVAAVAAAMLVLRGLSELSGERALPLKMLAGIALGVVLYCAAMPIGLGYSPLGAWMGSLHGNARFNELAGRSYAPWLGVNMLEWAVFLGLPLAVLSLGGLWSARRAWPGIALYAILLVLNVSGANRGEVARLWLPLMGVAAIAAAQTLSSIGSCRRWALPVLCVQFAQVVVLKLSLDALSLYKAS